METQVDNEETSRTHKYPSFPSLRGGKGELSGLEVAALLISEMMGWTRDFKGSPQPQTCAPPSPLTA